MRSSNNGVATLAPSLLVGADAQGWSTKRDEIIPDKRSRSKLTSTSPGRQVAVEKGTNMKFLANTAAFVVALSLMIGVLLAQRSYQNSWREPNIMQAPSSTVAQGGNVHATSDYKVVLK